MTDADLFGPNVLPYGVFEPADGPRRVGVRLHDEVIDLGLLAERLSPHDVSVLSGQSLNPLLAAGRGEWERIREWIHRAVAEADPALGGATYPLSQVRLHLPIEVADYVDFYASEYHATNVGRLLRPNSEALTPNWKHLPIGYHGRSGTVVVDGTDVIRPCGQRKGPADPEPVFGPSVRLDIETELGFVLGGSSTQGRAVTIENAAEHLFGVVILNDWSARDIQAWEYVPLGPFLGKSFATSISAWVLPFQALSATRPALPAQDPTVLPYLSAEDLRGLEIELQVELNGTVIATPQARDLYWSPEQMVAHLTVNGASVRPGELLGSGTISGPEKSTRGCLLELTWSGAEPLTLADGTTRAFLADGDTVTITAWAPGSDGDRIGLGAVTGTIRPALTC